MSETYPFLDSGNKITPCLPVIVLNPMTGKGGKFIALLDTGADTSMLPSYITKLLGHSFERQYDSTTKGVGGAIIPTWKNDVVIRLLDATEKVVLFTSPRITTRCVDHNEIPVILGTDNFLCNFKITLDYPSKTISLNW